VMESEEVHISLEEISQVLSEFRLTASAGSEPLDDSEVGVTGKKRSAISERCRLVPVLMFGVGPDLKIRTGVLNHKPEG